jgi:hypothetical protein
MDAEHIVERKLRRQQCSELLYTVSGREMATANNWEKKMTQTLAGKCEQSLVVKRFTIDSKKHHSSSALHVRKNLSCFLVIQPPLVTAEITVDVRLKSGPYRADVNPQAP